MPYTQAQIDAAKAQLAKLVKSVAYGDRNVSFHDVDQQLKAIAAMEADGPGAAGTTSIGRSTFAAPRRD